MGQSLWFVSRASGLVLLVVLSAVVVLGALQPAQVGRPVARAVVAGVHRALALLGLVFLVGHVAGAVVDGYTSLRWIDAVVPLASSYHPVGVGLGAVALDLLLALVVTSLLRAHIPARAWRGVHWAAYACWPVAVVHGWTMGYSPGGRLDWLSAAGRWTAVACVAAVAVAVARRCWLPSADRRRREDFALRRQP